VRSGDRIAWIGYPLDAEWASMLNVRIVAEVPVLSKRDGGIFRRGTPDKREVNAFWNANSEQRAHVFEAFRKVGATIVVTDQIPPHAEAEGWRQVLPHDSPHLPRSNGQSEWQEDLGFRRLP
jgi:hypothetical protein